MLRQALAVLPTRPAVILAPCIALLVLGLYYIDRHQNCLAQADFRRHFMHAMNEASEISGGDVNLMTVTSFSWDTLQILTGYKPNLNYIQNCPFNWDWSKEKLQHLVDNQRLTMLVFTAKGIVSRYLELDGALIDFEQVKNRYSNSEAKFKVVKDRATDTLMIREK